MPEKSAESALKNLYYVWRIFAFVKNMILAHTKDFCENSSRNSPDFQKKKNFKCHMSLEQVALYNINSLIFCIFMYGVQSQIWLNLLVG
jgi:hypothetical protein